MNTVGESYPYPNVTISRRIPEGKDYPFPHFIQENTLKAFAGTGTVLEHGTVPCRTYLKEKKKKKAIRIQHHSKR